MDIATPSGGGDGEVINGSTRFFPLLYPFPRISLNITRRRIFAAERRSQLKLSRIAESTFVSLVSLPFPRVSKSANSNLAEEHERIHSPCEKFSSNLQKFCYLSSGPDLSSSSLYKASAVALSTTLRIIVDENFSNFAFISSRSFLGVMCP